MYGLWIVCLCGVCNFSYFFCENVAYQLWMVCGLVFFSYGCSPPCALWCVGCVFVIYGRMVDGLVCWVDEGSVRLRYDSGRCQLNVITRMTEWGNPLAVMCRYLLMNS